MGKKQPKRVPKSKNPSSTDQTGDPKQQASPAEEPPGQLAGESSNGPATVKKTTITQYVSFGLLLGVVALFSFLFYEVMATFIVPLFLAALLVVVFRPIHNWIHEKCGGREKLAAALTTATVLLVVLVPISMLLVMAAAEGRQVIRHFNTSQITKGLEQIRTNLKLDMPSPIDIRTIEDDIYDLQHDIVLSEADYDRHRTDLYIIEESAKSLANAQSMEWPKSDSPAESGEQPTQSHWASFASNLEEARLLHSKMNWDSGASEKTEDLERQRQYQVSVNKMADSFAQFRTELLGGKTRAWIVGMVNPSGDDTDSYINGGVSFLKDKVLKLGGAGAAFLGNLVLSAAIMVIALYFFLLDGPKMIETFKGLSPIDDSHEQELVEEFSIVSRAVVLATLLSALAQGLLAGVGFYFAGLDSVFLLTVLSGVLAMVPFVGAAAVWIPCSLYLYFFDNNLAAAIGLAIYGAAIISMADNVIKPYVLHGQSNIHPLLALLSVLGGVTTLGPIGILVGPMVVAFLQTLLKILQREMMDMDQDGSPSQA